MRRPQACNAHGCQGDQNMMVHHEQRIVRCSQQSMFAVILDIESYPEFVPGWNAARIHSHKNDQLLVDQQLGVGPLHWNFTSSASYRQPEEVVIRSLDGPFKQLEINWRLARAVENHCNAELRIRAELSSIVFQNMVKRLFTRSSRDLITLFEQRACLRESSA